MKKMKITMILGFLLLFSWRPIGMAADFPQKPIRMIIPYGAGGGNDVNARAFQPALERVLGQRIVIENIPAGSTKLGTMELMKSKPDGYTLILSTPESWIGYYYSKTYETKVWEQMVPIANITTDPYGFVEVRAESPYKTWADLVKAAKEKPGQLSCGGPGAGGMMQLIMNEITKASGITTRYVPFEGAGKSAIALYGGHIDFRVCQPQNAIVMIRAGKSRGLAVSSEKRMAGLPDVPTFKELGLREGTITLSCAIWGPPKLPPDLVHTLTKAVEKAMEDPDFIKIIRDKLLLTLSYQPPEKMKIHMENFDKEFGPKLAEMYK